MISIRYVNNLVVVEDRFSVDSNVPQTDVSNDGKSDITYIEGGRNATGSWDISLVRNL